MPVAVEQLTPPGLGGFPLAAGLADDPKAGGAHAFPILRPEEAPAAGVRDVLLTMNRVYYPQASERLSRLGIRGYPILSGA